MDGGISSGTPKENSEESVDKILKEFWKKIVKKSPLEFLFKSLETFLSKNPGETSAGAIPTKFLKESYKGFLKQF